MLSVHRKDIFLCDSAYSVYIRLILKGVKIGRFEFEVVFSVYHNKLLINLFCKCCGIEDLVNHLSAEGGCKH